MPEMAVRARRAISFPKAKFHPPPLPATLVPRPDLLVGLEAGASARLTLVTGSPGSGKSALLAAWTAARAPSTTSWLSCDEADALDVRFCTGFIEAVRLLHPGFGADALTVLKADASVSPDAVALLANEVATLPAGTAIVIDDAHLASGGIKLLDDLLARWPPGIQLVIGSRIDPPVHLGKLRAAGQVREVRDRDLSFSSAHAQQLMTNFGVQLSPTAVSLLHDRSEGWVTWLQMAALALQADSDPETLASSLSKRSEPIADYFVSEVLDRQPAEVASFMLDAAVLDDMTPEVCAAVTRRPDSWLLLQRLEAANLFVFPLDDEHSAYRFHRLIRDVLRAQLHAVDQTREAMLYSRAADWFETLADTRQCLRYRLLAGDMQRAYPLLSDVILDHYFSPSAAVDDLGLATLAPRLAAARPEDALAVALAFLLAGEISRGNGYLDAAEESLQRTDDAGVLARLAATRAARQALLGDVHGAVEQGEAARASQDCLGVSDAWVERLPIALMNVHLYARDYSAMDAEIQRAVESRRAPETVERVLIPGVQALAAAERGFVDQAGDMAESVAGEAQELGVDHHYFAANYWLARAQVALERRHLPAAQDFVLTTLKIVERGRPPFAMLAHLCRAEVLVARQQLDAAMTAVSAARESLPDKSSPMLARVDEVEALTLLAWSDWAGALGAAKRVPPPRQRILLARIALAKSEPEAAIDCLGADPPPDTEPRDQLLHLVVRTAAIIETGRTNPELAVGEIIDLASKHGFVQTVVATTQQVPAFLMSRAYRFNPSPYLDRLVSAAVDLRQQAPTVVSRRKPAADPLSDRELSVLRLLPTSLSYEQIATALYVSLNTVKTHVRHIYIKLDVGSRAEAVARAIDLELL
jgi:LuxR family transcriptional regulator, maltose regulon positive regulatory protein